MEREKHNKAKFVRCVYQFAGDEAVTSHRLSFFSRTKNKTTKNFIFEAKNIVKQKKTPFYHDCHSEFFGNEEFLISAVSFEIFLLRQLTSVNDKKIKISVKFPS